MSDGVVLTNAELLDAIATQRPGENFIDRMRRWQAENDNGPGEGAVGLEDVEGVQGGERQIDSHEPG